MRRSPSAAVLTLALLLGACAVQTGTTPGESAGTGSVSSAALPESSSSSAVSSSTAASQAADEDVTAEPTASGTDSLETAKSEPQTVSGHLIVSTIGFGDTPETGGPPRLLEYFDYDCEYCRQHAMDDRAWLDADYVGTGKIGIERVFVAMTTAGKRMDQAALCAAAQDMFEPMDAYLLKNVPQTDPPIFTFARTLKMDQKQFRVCMDNMAVAEGSYDVPGGGIVTRIPAFSIGGQHWEGLLSPQEFRRNLDAAAK